MEGINSYEVASSPVVPEAGTVTPVAPLPVRVWLVDDNDELRTTVAELLQRVSGIECARHFFIP